MALFLGRYLGLVSLALALVQAPREIRMHRRENTEASSKSTSTPRRKTLSAEHIGEKHNIIFPQYV